MLPLEFDNSPAAVLRRVGRTVRLDMDRALSIEQLFRTAQRRRIIYILGVTPAGDAHARLLDVLMGDLVLALARAHDGIGSDRANLLRFDALLQDDSRVDALRRAFWSGDELTRISHERAVSGA